MLRQPAPSLDRLALVTLRPPGCNLKSINGTPMTPALKIQGLRKTYQNGFVALDGIDLEVAQGDFLSITRGQKSFSASFLKNSTSMSLKR